VSSLLDSLGRGAGQGATFGFGDEAIAKILAALPTDTSQDGGIPREYAAGSQEADVLQSERGANRAAAESNPGTYAVGAAAGGLPSAMAVPAAGGIAGAGLTGGLMGAVRGAGTADGGNMTQSVAKNAGLGGLFGAGGAAISAAAPAVKSVLANIGDDISGSGMAPAYAAVGGGTSRTAAPSALPSGAQISRAGMLPPRPTTGDLGDMPSIPKSGKPLVQEGAIDASEDFADASMVANTAKAMKGKPTDSQAAAYNKAAQGYDKAARPQTEKSVAKTAPPKRGRVAAGARPTMPADTFEVPTGVVRKPQATVPAPAPQGTPSMRPTQPAPAGTPTMPAPPSRPTMMDLGPVKPTLRPGSEREYMDMVLEALKPAAIGR
jgi:hypothetical protein